MKRSFLFSAVLTAVIALLYTAFSTDSVSSPMPTGTIKVCWGPTCSSAPVTTDVQLRDAHGHIVGSCQIKPPEDCCKITGDFPTGTYYFTYNRPTGISQCTTGTFSYTNGTDITISPICYCP